MFLGHFAVGLAAKRIAPRVSLGSLIVAAEFPDLLGFTLLAAGVEHASIQPGITEVNSLNLYDYPISHSLLMGVVWGGLLAFAYLLWRRWWRGAWVVLAAVVSHWVLDWVSHRPDLPLAPGVHRYFGLGLWNSTAATFAVEGLLWAAGLFLYVRATRPKKRSGVYAFWSMAAVLTLLWLASLRGTAPPNLRMLEIFSLVLFAAVLPWAYWVDRVRGSREMAGTAGAGR